MMRVLLFLLFGFSFYAPLVQALQFSAQAVMFSPGRADVTTQLYYSGGRIRKEFYYYGEPVIQILDANKHISLMCFTDQQLCYQNKTMEKINIGIESAVSSPCDESSTLKCENLGEEKLNERNAIQWKITTQEKDKELVTHLWLDAELKIPVKQSLFNGSTIELVWQGGEKLGNRDTEKWLQTITLPNGDKQQSYQWYDKELKISIRQTFPNGNSQELKHIVVENLPDKLFTIPVGFEKKLIKDQTVPGSQK